MSPCKPKVTLIFVFFFMAVRINENQREQKSVPNTKREAQGNGGLRDRRDPLVLGAYTWSVRVYTHWDTLYPPPPRDFSQGFHRDSMPTQGVPGRYDLCLKVSIYRGLPPPGSGQNNVLNHNRFFCEGQRFNSM